LKLLVALFALMLAIGLASLWLWRRSPADAPCASRDLAQARSPDGRTQADVFEVRCGNSLATHVALRPAGAPEAARGDVFIAAGTAPVRLTWNGPGELVLESPAKRVLVEETRWRTTSIRILRSP